VPNLPPPGKPLDLSKLVALKSYSFSSDRGFKISASASLPNPSLKNVPCALPFAIQIGPNHDTIAQVVASASTITTHRIGIQIEGDIVDLESGDALSSFLQNFLQGIDNPITVRGMSSMPGDYSGPNAPPPWVLRSLPSLELGLVFPAPTDQPDIIRSVTIEKMNLGEENGNIVASGTVVALVQLPDEMKQLSLNISAIRPDIMVHNGPVSGNDEYDPDHPPPRAFGRIAPDYFLNATTAVDPNTPGVLVIRAPFENLLLNVLDGRDNVLRDFVSQVIFKGGATAGIAGITDVQADVGVGGVLAVNGLPVQGEFFVGRNLMPMEYIGEFTRNRIAQLAGGASH
jgi:hypothetical protein